MCWLVVAVGSWLPRFCRHGYLGQRVIESREAAAGRTFRFGSGCHGPVSQADSVFFGHPPLQIDVLTISGADFAVLSRREVLDRTESRFPSSLWPT
jgi:hypothetical protein